MVLQENSRGQETLARSFFGHGTNLVAAVGQKILSEFQLKLGHAVRASDGDGNVPSLGGFWTHGVRLVFRPVRWVTEDAPTP